VAEAEGKLNFYAEFNFVREISAVHTCVNWRAAHEQIHPQEISNSNKATFLI